MSLIADYEHKHVQVFPYQDSRNEVKWGGCAPRITKETVRLKDVRFTGPDTIYRTTYLHSWVEGILLSVGFDKDEAMWDSYVVFEEPNWVDKVSKKVITSAEFAIVKDGGVYCRGING